jgi:hypothetical protein
LVHFFDQFLELAQQVPHLVVDALVVLDLDGRTVLSISLTGQVLAMPQVLQGRAILSLLALSQISLLAVHDRALSGT